MTRNRVAIAVAALLAAAGLALGVTGAAGAAGPLPPALLGILAGPKVVRAEVVVVNGGRVHDYRIDRGRIASVAAESVVLAERDGTMQTVPLDPSVSVTVNGRPAQVGRLRSGMEATTVRDGDAGATWLVATGRGKR
jgi:hypothetical protein